MLAPTRVFRQFEQYAKPVPGQTGAGFVVSGGVFALQRFYKMYRVDDAEAVGVGGGGCQEGKRKEKRKSVFWDCQAGICKNILTTICCCIKMRVTNNT